MFNPRKLTSRFIFASSFIATVVALLYVHTLQVPFYLDDTRALVENERLRDLAAALRSLLQPRGLTDLTFALNYRLSGWDLMPLHAVNITLHAGCGFLVWLLLRRLFSNHRWLPLLGALLFVAHPLQTEGVTYLVQRATTLGAFLFLLAFFLYVRARSALPPGQLRSSAAPWYPYAGAVLIGAGAVLAKENTATLPLVLVVYDRLFSPPEKRARPLAVLEYAPFFVAPLILGATWFLLPLIRGEAFVVDSGVREFHWQDSLSYLMTQFTVIWVYLRLLVFPSGQALVHNYPLAGGSQTVCSLVGLCGLLLIVYLAWRLRKARPLVTLGVAWFFLALAVESSFIPLDPLFEHRLYLPMFGFLLAALDGGVALLGERKTLVLGVAAVSLCMPLTWQRNALWNDPIAFYRDNLRAISDSGQAGGILSLLCQPGSGGGPGHIDLHYDLGLALAQKGQLDEAIEEFRKVLLANPANNDARTSLGIALANKGQLDEAIEEYKQVIERNPEHVLAHYNLGKVLIRKNQYDEAIAEFKKAIQLQPGLSQASDNLIYAYELKRTAEGNR